MESCIYLKCKTIDQPHRKQMRLMKNGVLTVIYHIFMSLLISANTNVKSYSSNVYDQNIQCAKCVLQILVHNLGENWYLSLRDKNLQINYYFRYYYQQKYYQQYYKLHKNLYKSILNGGNVYYFTGNRGRSVNMKPVTLGKWIFCECRDNTIGWILSSACISRCFLSQLK